MKTKQRAAVTRCHYSLPEWAAMRLCRPSTENLRAKIAETSVRTNALTFDWKSLGLQPWLEEKEHRATADDCFVVDLPKPIAAGLDTLGKAHGLTRRQCLSFILKWAALHMPVPAAATAATPDGSDEDDWELEGEDWKNT